MTGVQTCALPISKKESVLKPSFEKWRKIGESFWQKGTEKQPLLPLTRKLPEPNKISKKDLNAIPFISVLPEKIQRATYGTIRGLLKTAESFTTRNNIALMVGSAGAGDRKSVV